MSLERKNPEIKLAPLTYTLSGKQAPTACQVPADNVGDGS